MSETRQRIIDSLFASPNSDSSYEAHVKIWEDDENGGRKPRFIVLAYSRVSGKGKILKTKLNTTGSYSVGKTWDLDSLRGLEVQDPRHFNITLARTYRWDTESPREQTSFLISLVRLFRKTNPAAPLNIVGNIPESTPIQYAGAPTQRPSISQGESPHQSNGPPPTTRRIAGHNRTSSASSSVGIPSSPAPTSTFRRPVAVSSSGPLATPSSPTRSSSGRISPLPAPVPVYRTQRPSTITSEEFVPPRPPLSPSRSLSGRRSPPGRSTLRGRTGTAPAEPVDIPRASARTPSTAMRGSASSPFMSSISSNTLDSLSSMNRPVVNGAPLQARRSNESQRSDAVNGHTQSRPSLEVPRAASPALSTSSASRSKATTRSDSPSRSLLQKQQRSRVPSPASSSRMKFQRDESPEYRPIKSDAIKRDPHARVSYFDPVNQQFADRLLSQDPSSPTDDGLDDEDLEATLTNVEEILEGYEWTNGADSQSKKNAKGTADQIEARLIGELNALEKANTHSFIESDDRISALLGFIDEAIEQLDQMDSLISSYKIHLNVVGDDISHIQSQNRGLQVQTQNQRTLLDELDQLLQTVNVDRNTLLSLSQEKLDSTDGVARLEESATALYKALQASRDGDMAASMERLEEYRTFNSQFCKRVFDFLQIMIPAQSDFILNDPSSKNNLVIRDHKEMEAALGRYSGIILYLKEMDEDRYGKLCASYFSSASELYSKQIKILLLSYAAMVKKTAEEDIENFSSTPSSATKPVSALRRAGTVIRSDRKERTKETDGEMRGYEALSKILDQIGNQIFREEDFMADFLQINDAALTFADYLGLESYFRRQASRSAGLSATTTKLVRSAMDLIFGFLPEELKRWIEAALQRDNLQIAGMIASLERFLTDADERGSVFFLRLLDRQHARIKGSFERHIDDQIKAVERTKITAKKRKGVAHFIKYFPVYVQRTENQLIGSDGLEIRGNVDAAYERIVDAMFDALRQMAKMDGEGEDKDKSQLNYHVILIENMHHFVLEIDQLELGAMGSFSRRAQGIYEENLNAYVKIVLRRPFSKILEYFEGVERLLQTTAPSEISNNSTYSKSALKRVLKEYNAKDIKRLVDVLYKRVEKHFSESSSAEEGGTVQAGSALPGVWKACEEEAIQATERFTKLIEQCYPSSGLSLEYNVADAKGSFKRHV